MPARPTIRRAALVLAAAATTAFTASASLATEPAAAQRPVDPSYRAVVEPVAPLPLAGVRIGLDPGHQLGNSRFPAKISALVPAGGFLKPCNTTGTATNAGYPEASLAFAIVRSAQVRLEKLGASVYLTRNVNSLDVWGPCVDVRGRFGAKVGADLVVSVHGDGAPASGRGFHVITPTERSPWTTDIAEPSRRLALALRSGFDSLGLPRSNYVNHGYGLTTRWDLATLNLSDVPVAMVEVGNMRNTSDANRMTTVAGRIRYAEAVVAGIRTYLAR